MLLSKFNGFCAMLVDALSAHRTNAVVVSSLFMIVVQLLM